MLQSVHSVVIVSELSFPERRLKVRLEFILSGARGNKLLNTKHAPGNCAEAINAPITEWIWSKQCFRNYRLPERSFQSCRLK